MTAPLVVGVDPGGRWTGLVARRGDELLDHAVLESPMGGEAMVPSDYLVTIIGWIGHWMDEMDADLVGMERATKPAGRRRDGEVEPIAPGSLIGLGMVCGAVLVNYPDTIIVPQSGTDPLYAYPKALVGPRETTGTGGRLRHARSAWSVAGGAATIGRMNAAVNR